MTVCSPCHIAVGVVQGESESLPASGVLWNSAALLNFATTARHIAVSTSIRFLRVQAYVAALYAAV